MRKCFSFTVDDNEDFKQCMVHYCREIEYAVLYDSNNYYEFTNSEVDYHSFDFMAGLGNISSPVTSMDELERFVLEEKDWLLGYLGYDLKNDLENLYSINSDGLGFPKLLFFQPQFVIKCINENWHVQYHSKECTENDIIELINKIKAVRYVSHSTSGISFVEKVSKDKYCQSINAVLEHIHKGDIYELNYCMEFYAEQVELDPYNAYLSLNQISPTPFSAFCKMGNHFVLSASPERFLKKEGTKLISQPIKGTAKRGVDEAEDVVLKNRLQSDIKEQSENIMITDLVRNDLSKVARKGSVKVEELCGIYPFKQVFQMISTISANLDANSTSMDAIKASFPPGSMTGAPKIRAMKLIEKYEETKRGVYSGGIGYFSPDGDFDFNVVIRSLFYNAQNRYLSFMVGSAITEKSIPEKEYEECLLKAKAIFQLFNSSK